MVTVSSNHCVDDASCASPMCVWGPGYHYNRLCTVSVHDTTTNSFTNPLGHKATINLTAVPENNVLIYKFHKQMMRFNSFFFGNTL